MPCRTRAWLLYINSNSPPFPFSLVCVCLQNTNDNNINNHTGIKESKCQTPIDRTTAGDYKNIFDLFFKKQQKKKENRNDEGEKKVSTFFLINSIVI